MWKRNAFLLLGILLIACHATTNSVEPVNLPGSITPLPTPASQVATWPVDDNLRQLAAEFRSLREIPGRFGGGPPNDEVDQWQGRKHQLMRELGTRIGNKTFSRAQLVELLGPADHVVTTGDPLMQYIASLPNYPVFSDSDLFLVYEWRGTHDFLFFAVQDEQVTGSDWWYAFE